jgi:hypothetical protein
VIKENLDCLLRQTAGGLPLFARKWFSVLYCQYTSQGFFTKTTALFDIKK